MKFNSLLVTLVLALTQIHSGLATDTTFEASISEGKTPLAKDDLQPATNGKTANEYNKETIDQYKASKDKLEETRTTLGATLDNLSKQIQKLEDQLRKSDAFIKVTQAEYDKAISSRDVARKEVKRLQALLRGNIDDTRRAGNNKNRQELDALKFAKDEQQKAERIGKDIDYKQKLAESVNKDVQGAANV